MMKRVWVKKEHMYYKPFYKQKLKMGLLLVILSSVVFFSYQIFCMRQLSPSSSFFDSQADSGAHQKGGHYSRFQSNKTASHHPSAAPFIGGHPKQGDPRLRGVHTSQYSQYNGAKPFRCFSSGVEIPFDKVNDDYCDCEEDGSDEPATNACSRGKFFCAQSMKSIPSSRVNDRICDCCDGSDEWNNDDDNVPHLPPALHCT